MASKLLIVARIERTKFGSQSGKPLMLRGAQAVGGAAVRGVGRLVRKLIIFALIVIALIWWAQSVSTKLQQPGTPVRSVSAVESGALERWQTIRTQSLDLTEGDMTAVFQAATKLPTFPFTNGQVAVQSDTLEIFGRLRSPAWTARILATPVVRDEKIELKVERVMIGQQRVPRWLQGLISLPALNQAALIANTALPPVESVALHDHALTIQFK